MNITLLRVLLAFASLIATASVVAQTESAPAVTERLRVGLVLGGGGARGAAHIGVLQELERLRIPIDAVAGTSMGAIVGGLYASGMSPADLQQLVESLDWADAFDDQSERANRRYRRKQDDATYSIPLELGLRDGSLQLPKGLIQGQKLSLILREQLLPVYNIDNFDELPTPFRAVAADLETGEAYVMSRGDMELAIRASMSAPGVFAPVMVDGRVLVDGGLVGNIPVSVVREMDVDIVIAVDVEFPLYALDELHSALAITEQMLTILIRKETLRSLSGLGDDDFLIRPEMGQYSSTNFQDIAQTIQPGVAATAAFGGQLARLSISEDEFQHYLSSRRQRINPPAEIDFVRVIDNGLVAGKTLESLIQTSPGDTVNAARLADDAKFLFGLQRYEQVSYRIVEDDDKTGVEFETRAKSWGPNFLNFGISLEDDFEGTTAINFAGRMTRTGLNARGADWRTDLQVGSDPRLATEFYQPLGRGSQYFIAPRIDMEQSNVNVFSGEANIARYRIGEIEAALDIGRALGRWGEFRLGAYRGGGKGRRITGDPQLPNFDFASGGVRARFAIDTFDDAQLPAAGSKFDVDWKLSRPAFGADSDFDTVSSKFDRAWSWNGNIVQLGLEYQTTLRADNQVQDFFSLGGFLRLSGLDRGAIAGPHSGLTRLVYYRQMDETGGGPFHIPLYVGGSIEAGNAWQSRSDMSFDAMILNGSLFAAVDTYVGPLFLAAGFSEHGDTSFYLFLGAPLRR